jgi:spore maturation protein CgeB
MLAAVLHRVSYQENWRGLIEIGRELLCYDGSEDLAGLIRYYMAHEDES